MKAEVYFLRYAFPCSFILRSRKELDEKQVKELEHAAIHKKAVSRALLEKVYFRAFEKIQAVADELGKDKWDITVLREYWRKRHNEIIEKGMYSYANSPESLRNLCKVHEAVVKDVKDDTLVVEYDHGRRRPVLRAMVPDAKIDDVVTIHYGYAVEKIKH